LIVIGVTEVFNTLKLSDAFSLDLFAFDYFGIFDIEIIVILNIGFIVFAFFILQLNN